MPRQQVKTAPLASLLEPYEHSVAAQALSINDSQLSAQITATVIEVPIGVGETVTAGQLLVQLDCQDAENRWHEMQSTLVSLEARARLARRQFERAQKLRQQQGIAEEDLNRRESELTAATAERDAQSARLAISRRDVEHCDIRAPYNGVVTERYAQIGQTANTGSLMLRIIDTDNVEVSADIVADDVVSLRQAQSPAFIYDHQLYPLELKAIAGAIDTRTRTQKARLLFTADKPVPGAAGRLVWQDHRPALPAHWILRRNGELGVLIAEESQAVFRPVPGAREGQPAFVDLPMDTPVITDGRFGLSPGDSIAVVQ